ncbi:MAG: DNA repair protein RadA [Gemmatimonadaceae bacterium]|nr:DNA repair protein RadA [Gemmatimonadaceae bacterium]
MVEEAAPRATGRIRAAQPPRPSATTGRRLGDVPPTEAARIRTGIEELDHVLGGGLVRGSLVLVGGEPGIGKSTLVLQLSGHLAAAGRPTIYVSAEESPAQVRLRADRLAVDCDAVELLGETALDVILDTLEARRPELAVIDSIQTVWVDTVDGAPGNVSQVRECASRLQRWAKSSGCALFLVGHVTKGGGIAGPRMLEHVVDTVLYFEGEHTLDHRILRATKNRFGSVDEVGVFRMTGSGLDEVANPSALFLDAGELHPPGSATTALMEGTRPLLVEVQGLAAKAGYGTPQRVANGLDPRRLALLLAVLERRAGVAFSSLDVFLNVVGGLRLQETASDLAIAAALVSSVYDRPLRPHSVLIGELGLGGEVRPVGKLERRLAEAAQLGLTTAFVSARSSPPRGAMLEVVPVRSASDLLERAFV